MVSAEENAHSLYRDALCEVPGLVDGTATHVCDVVGEQLQRNNSSQRLELQLCGRAVDDKTSDPLEVAVPIVRQDDHRGIPGPQLRDIGLYLGVGWVGRHCNANDRDEVADQCQGPMLHLGRQEPLGVNVRDLLELQRALERHREVDPRAAEESVVSETEVLGNDLDLLVQRFKPRLDQVWHSIQGVAIAVKLPVGDEPALQGQLQRDHQERNHLPSEGLGRRDANLRAGVQVDAGIRGTRDAGADAVDDAHRHRLALLGDADRLEGVRGLAALRDGHDDVLRGDQGSPVAELAGVLHLHRQLRQALERVLADQPRVEGRAAGADDDPRGRGHPLQRAEAIVQGLLQATKLQPPELLTLVPVEPAAHGVPQRVWLVHDLLEHEVPVARFLDLLKGHLQPNDWIVDRPGAQQRQRHELRQLRGHVQLV
mmetsp:Transcript_28124/g.81105  ORF Transcript_28124/g.81105 Transcript_28124/m.81105 type:complete len:427 (-) Transcript_28124:629-1909(-)